MIYYLTGTNVQVIAFIDDLDIFVKMTWILVSLRYYLIYQIMERGRNIGLASMHVSALIILAIVYKILR